jgi:hypothetical protein
MKSFLSDHFWPVFFSITPLPGVLVDCGNEAVAEGF